MVSPLSIILVKSDSKGDRLLFRYPFKKSTHKKATEPRLKNAFTLPYVEDLLQSPLQPISNIHKNQLTGFTDEVLSSLFAVKPELCNRKFELKINDVRFISHPTLLQLRNKTQEDASRMMLINIVFALPALASKSVVVCYHDLSQRMGISLKHEEKRCGYVSEETQTMTTALDEGFSTNSEHTFQTILEKSTLAQNIYKIYNDLSTTGIINTHINRWISLSFCLPQKVHQWHLRGKLIEPDDVDRCLKSLRPYHSILLLYTVEELNEFTSIDGSPSLNRLFAQYSPLKNLQTLAADADLTLNHAFELAAHLVYWAKAIIIFPICSTNKYVIAPDAPVYLNSPLNTKFEEAFPGHNLITTVCEFSLPTSLGQKCNPLFLPSQQSHLVQTVSWMLQHQLLIQIHTYIQYIPTEAGCIGHTHFSLSNANLSLTTFPLGTMLSTEFSQATSESETSTFSEGQELNNDTDPKLLSNLNTTENTTFSSVEEEKPEYQEELLSDFPDDERTNIFKIPATNNPEDLRLFALLCRKGYFDGKHHIEEIMYMENLRRSQLMQLLDKFRDVLFTFETEDPTISMLSYT